jgi:predicted peroxiredoxin
MRWKAALNHATALADQGYETTIHVHALAEGMAERTATVRVLKTSIPVPELDAFFAQAKEEGLAVKRLELADGVYFELS